LFPVPTCL